MDRITKIKFNSLLAEFNNTHREILNITEKLTKSKTITEVNANFELDQLSYLNENLYSCSKALRRFLMNNVKGEKDK